MRIKSFILLIVVALSTSCYAYSGGNLVWSDRFNTDLSNWTLDTTGGTVSIVTQDNSPKMKLNDTSDSEIVSATRSITLPANDWNLEFDIYHSASSVSVMELLDASDTVLITVSLGITETTLSFSTNSVAESTDTVAIEVYKQVVLHIDSGTVGCWISEDDTVWGSQKRVGGDKAFTGTIAKIRFRTDTAAQGIIYIDEVRAYVPDVFIIGDSLSQAIPYWATNPQTAQRLLATEDETSPPSQQLADNWSNTWIANRAFGGSTLDSADTYIQSVVIDQGAKRVIIAEGHNDFCCSLGLPLAAMQTDMISMITKLQNAGITTTNILLVNVAPSALIATAGEKAFRRTWNRWLQSKANNIGGIYIDLSTAWESAPNSDTLNAAYDYDDGTHPNKTGSGAFATAIYNAIELWDAKPNVIYNAGWSP